MSDIRARRGGARRSSSGGRKTEVTISGDGVRLEGTLTLPHQALAIVAVLNDPEHGRDHPRNRFIADILRSTGIGTLALDLLTRAEDRSRSRSASPPLAQEWIPEHAVAAVNWLGDIDPARDVAVGLLGHGPAATAALKAAAMRPDRVAAVVSSEGRPDPAEPSLSEGTAAILLVVPGCDAHAFHVAVPIRIGYSGSERISRRSVTARCFSVRSSRLRPPIQIQASS